MLELGGDIPQGTVRACSTRSGSAMRADAVPAGILDERLEVSDCASEALEKQKLASRQASTPPLPQA